MTEVLARLRAARRQRRHHPAFRIAPPTWDDAQRVRLERVAADLRQAATAVPDRPGPDGTEPTGTQPAVMEPAPSSLDDKALAAAATDLWRARRRLDRLGKDRTPAERQTARYLRAVDEALTTAGITVQSHDGDRFDPGLSLEVLAFSDEPDVTAEVVVDTVKPSVYLADRRIQMGQVIVGRPARPAPAGSGGTTNHA